MAPPKKLLKALEKRKTKPVTSSSSKKQNALVKQIYQRLTPNSASASHVSTSSVEKRPDVFGFIGDTLRKGVSYIPEVFKGARGLIDRISGFGDYTVKHNSLMGRGPNASDPGLFSGKQGDGSNLVHREYIGDILTPSNGLFGLATLSSTRIGSTIGARFLISPTNALLMPYGATQASQFEEFELCGMIFEFKSTSSVALSSTTNVQMGNVIMCFQPNPYDKIPTNKQDCEQIQWCTSSRISDDALAPIECDKSQTPNNGVYFTFNANANNTAGDLRWSNAGIFNVFVSGAPNATNNIGELWVTYHFRCMKPKQPVRAGLTDHYYLNTGFLTTAYWGLVLPTTTTPDSNLGTSLTNATISFPLDVPSIYQITIVWVGTAAALSMPTVTASNGASILNFWNLDTVPIISTGLVTSSILLASFVVLVAPTVANSQSSLSPTLTFTGGTLPSAGSWGDLLVSTISTLL